MKLLGVSAGLFLVALIIQAITLYKFTEIKSKQDPNPQYVTLKERERQLECLAINIYKEAAHEPFEGKVAVAQVVMNRAAHPAYPKDICAVVYQRNQVMQHVVCQFSWYCDNVQRNRPISDHYQESYDVAKKVLLENFRLPSLKDALFYHATYVNPRWDHERIIKIGRHIFYKPKAGSNLAALAPVTPVAPAPIPTSTGNNANAKPNPSPTTNRTNTK